MQVGQQKNVFILNKSPGKSRLLSYCPTGQVLYLPTHPRVQDRSLLPITPTLQTLVRKEEREAAPSPRLGALICENRGGVDVRNQWIDILCQSSQVTYCVHHHLQTSPECFTGVNKKGSGDHVTMGCTGFPPVPL